MSSNICASNAGADQVHESYGAKKTHFETIDANEAAARVAYRAQYTRALASFPIKKNANVD